MTTPAPDDAKAAISQQLVTVEKFGSPGEIGIAPAYVQTNVIKNDVKQYEPWTSSWAPLSTGGWYSSEDILNRADAVLSKVASQGYKPVSSDTRISTTTPPAIFCNDECHRKAAKDKCDLLAQELFGKTAALLPGAGDMACKYGKTGLYLTVGLVGVTLAVGVAFILRPYASIAAAAIARKKRKKR